MMWCPVLSDRRHKFEMIMSALEKGWPGAKLVYGYPPLDANPVMCYGQIWGSEKLLKQACQYLRPYWHIDNGFWRPGRGNPDGYYRFTYRSMCPILLDAPSDRFHKLDIKFAPWRKDGSHILLALPGLEYGIGIGLDMPTWISEIKKELPLRTDRKIIVRDRKETVPLKEHFKDCWAVVTHSSNVAVDAVCAGIPVFVLASSSAAPVGNLGLYRLEDPLMPERTKWAQSLAYQQFTVPEMRDGTARRCLKQVEDATIHN